MRAIIACLFACITFAGPAGAEPLTTTALPNVRLISGPAPVTSSRSATFRFESADATIGFVCALDGGAAGACSSPASYGDLPDGTHVFNVAALSAAGDAGPATEFTWTVDTVPPTVQLRAVPLAVSTTSFAEFDFSSSEPGVSFACSLDGSAKSLAVSPVAFSALAPGTHTFSVTPTDRAGNVGPTVTYTWAVSVSARTPAAVSGLLARPRYRQVALSWQQPGDPDFDHVVILRALGSSPSLLPIYYGSATQFVDKTVDNSRAYRYVALVIDKAGNASQGASVTIDPASLLLSPGSGSTVRAPVRLTWTRVGGATLYNVQLWRGGRKILSAWPRRARLALASRWRFSGRSYALAPGKYQWYVWPAFGRAPHVTYGTALGQSAFTRAG